MESHLGYFPETENLASLNDKKHMDDATKWNKGSGLIQVVPNTANT